MTEHEINFIQIGKGYLSLLYLKSQYEILGKEPPDDLSKGVVILEKQLQHISKTIE